MSDYDSERVAQWRANAGEARVGSATVSEDVENRSVFSGGVSDHEGDEDAARRKVDRVLARLVCDRSGLGLSGDVGSLDDDGDDGSELGSPASVFSGGGELQMSGGEDVLQPLVEADRRFALRDRMNQMRRGRPLGGGFLQDDFERDMLRFDPSEEVVLADLAAAKELCEKIGLLEVVEARVLARTGLGKTTRLPAMVANVGKARVLLLVADGRMAQEAREELKKQVRVATRGFPGRLSVVRVMTYCEFVTSFHTKNGQVLMRQTDVVMMDESHLPEADVFVAGVLLATFKPAALSVLKMSATHGDDDVQSVSRAGSVLYRDWDLCTMFENGTFFVSDNVRDQTMVIVPTDEIAGKIHAAIREQGYKSYLLDTASTSVDVARAREAMGGSSSSTRFLVTTNSYGTGANFPVRFVYTMARRAVWEVEQDRVVEKLIPLTVAEVKQHVGRVGRGLAQGAGAVVCLVQESIAPAVSLLRSEMLKAYLMLRAAHVAPIRQLMQVERFLPQGITPMTAQEVLAVNLPPVIALRFFAADGMLPAQFARAAGVYSVETMFMSSRHVSPFMADRWVDDCVGGYYGEDVTSDRIRVPVVVEGSMRVRVHAICALAMRRIVVESDWLPEADGSGSDSETVTTATVKGRYQPRWIENSPKVASQTPRIAPEWTYDVSMAEQLGPARSRGGFHGGDMPETIQDLLMTARKLDPTYQPQFTVKTDREGVERVRVTVESPRVDEGSPVSVRGENKERVALIRQTVYRQLTEAKVLTPADTLSLLRSVKYTAEELAKSDLFSYWANPWLSVLKTLSDGSVVSYINAKGLITTLQTLLFSLFERYKWSVEYVATQSLVHKKMWRRVLDVGVREAHKRAMRRGEADVLQSEDFYLRIYEIRELFVEAVRACEQRKVFDSGMIVQLQSMLPIARPTGSKLIDSAATKGKKLLGFH